MLERLIADIVGKVEELSWVKTERILVSFTQARKRTPWGIYAKVVPCGGPGLEWKYGSSRYSYLLYVYLPRFHDLDVRGKVNTVVHELLHISDACDGTLRTYPGRDPLHGGGLLEARASALASRYMDFVERKAIPRPLLEFLGSSLEKLQRLHGPPFGRWIRLPRMP